MYFFLNIVTDIKETASAINFALMKLIIMEENNIVIGMYSELLTQKLVK